MLIMAFALGRLEGGSVHLLGTCFLVKSNTLATAAHNFDGNDKNIVAILPENLDDLNAYQQQTRPQLKYVRLALQDIDPVHDLAIFAVIDGGSVNHPRMPKLASTDTMAVGDKVFTLGYP